MKYLTPTPPDVGPARAQPVELGGDDIQDLRGHSRRLGGGQLNRAGHPGEKIGRDALGTMCGFYPIRYL
jgi:hypothetical protein